VEKGIPALVVSMWWNEQESEECCDFLKGIKSTNERCAILTQAKGRTPLPEDLTAT
jgi:hypothetical protein